MRAPLLWRKVIQTFEINLLSILVKSFGTEDRPTAHPVKARDEVYEYIIFKAADIKDLVVCESPKQGNLGGLDYDPAIVSVSKPPEPQATPSNASPKSK
jgi:protein LSM14